MSAKAAEYRTHVAVYLLGACLCLTAGQVRAAVYLSPCTLSQDPQVSIEPLSTCLEGGIGAWGAQHTVVNDGIQPPFLYSAHGRATTLLTRALTLQVSGYYRHWQSRSKDVPTFRESNSDRAVLQIGNEALHRHRLFAGRAVMPFGLNLSTLSRWYGFETSRFFYGSPTPLAGYTYDNQRDLTWVVAVADQDKLQHGASKRDATFITRVAFDMAALEGTRAIATLASSEHSERRGGVALLNRNGKGEITSLEVVRKWTQFPYDPSDFRQLIRANWSGKVSDTFRMSVQYEDILELNRIGTVSSTYRFLPHLNLENTVGFSKSENELERNHWLFAMGLEATL